MARIDKQGYLNKIQEWYGNKVELLSEYYGKEKRVTICYHCEKHGDTVKEMIAKNVFDRAFNPCKECKKEKKSISTANAHKMTKEDLYNRLVDYCASFNCKVLENEWISAKTVYHFKCSNPDHPVFESSADSLYAGKHQCPYCSGRRGNFAQQIEKIITDKGGVLLSPYVNNSTNLRVKCLKHNHEWSISPVNLLKGKWCNVCSMSINELTVFDWLTDHNYNIDVQYKFDDLIGENGNPYRFDFAILNDDDSLRCLIEIDDETHRSHKKCYEDAHKRDRAKDEYCEKNDIALYRVPIQRWKIADKGRDWYYNYIDEQFSFLKGEVV